MRAMPQVGKEPARLVPKNNAPNSGRMTLWEGKMGLVTGRYYWDAGGKIKKIKANRGRQ